MSTTNLTSNYLCRVCQSTLTNKILHLSNSPLTDEFTPSGKIPREYLKDIDIFRCKSCGLVQNPADFDHSSYYDTYEYSSGHSEFAKKFMSKYALTAVEFFLAATGRKAVSVIEVGSGDGVQLKAFEALGIRNLLGIEPSTALVKQSEGIGIPAIRDLFTTDLVKKIQENNKNFDILISSYTLDHVRDPVNYLKAAHALLSPGGVLVFEVHDLEKIVNRSEWCLFEHEHTVYMDSSFAKKLVESCGFKLLAINPIDEKDVRANSLILVAQKQSQYYEFMQFSINKLSDDNHVEKKLIYLQENINNVVMNINNWISKIPEGERLIGFGAGGRGVMTLALLHQAKRFSAIFDSNYRSDEFLTPKTHLPIMGLNDLEGMNDSWCLIFSFGYKLEIKKLLGDAGFSIEKIISLDQFYPS